MFLFENIAVTIPLDNQDIIELIIDEEGLFYKYLKERVGITNTDECHFFMVDDKNNILATLGWTPFVAFQYLREKNKNLIEFKFKKL